MACRILRSVGFRFIFPRPRAYVANPHELREGGRRGASAEPGSMVSHLDAHPKESRLFSIERGEQYARVVVPMPRSPGDALLGRFPDIRFVAPCTDLENQRCLST